MSVVLTKKVNGITKKSRYIHEMGKRSRAVS